jgi:centromere/kinetochore protein ZW10
MCHGLQVAVTKSSLAPKPSPKVIDNLPTVTVPQLLEALGRLDELQPLLTTTQKVIMKDIVRPLLPTSGDDRRWIVEESSTEDLVLLRLIPSPEDAEPDTAQTLAGLQAVFTFVTSHLAATESAWVPPFHNSLRSAILQTTLDCLVQSTIPDALSDLPGWLDRTRQTVAFEKAILDASSTEEAGRPLQRFADTQAAQTWANRRRQMVADHVRQLIDGPGGWRGWDGRTVQRKTDISEIVEVEVDDDEQTAPVPAQSNAPVSSDTDADFGWGFDDEAVPQASSSTSPAPAEQIEVDDGWGFDDKADGSARRIAEVSADSIEDGWDFDDAAVPAPMPVVPKKPMREARKLGKLKAKHSQKPTSPLSSPSSRSPRTSFDKPPKDRQGDGWSEGWEDQGSPSKKSKMELAPDPVTKPRKVVLQERKRVVEESLLISVACDDAVETARQVLRDSVQLESSMYVPSEVARKEVTSVRSHVSPEDLAASQVALRNSARDVFDLYRALMPLTFGRQLRDVPSIAMQLYNDCNHLADEVSALKTEFELWTETSEDLEHRLRVFGQRNFEAQMASDSIQSQADVEQSLHKESILESLQEADGFVDTVTEASFRKCERAVRQATHKLESLNRVWRVRTKLSRRDADVARGYCREAYAKTLWASWSTKRFHKWPLSFLPCRILPSSNLTGLASFASSCILWISCLFHLNPEYVVFGR